MRRVSVRWFLGLVASCVACYPFHASRASDAAGETAVRASTGALHGVPYRIDIPQTWNGSLVVLLHGYEPKGAPRQSPWPRNEEAPVFLARGYAVAASAYASQGWAVGDALADSEQLRQLFSSENGKPHRTYAVGFSLGGLEALAMAERHGMHYDGALSMCGVNVSAPDIIARGVVTPLVAFDAYFPGVLPDLAAPASPAMVDQERIGAALKGDPARAARLQKTLQETGETLPGALMLDYMVLREIEQRAGGMPVDTTRTRYSEFSDDASFDTKVHRYAGTPSAMSYLSDHVTLSGRVAIPVVLQRNAFDPTVPSRFDAVYPALAKAAGKASNVTVLPPVGEGHCAFTHEQIGHAFDVLVEKTGEASR